ncbi:MAG: S-layer homology domain-containing protein [Oscillospiraceae bacterium]|nr:S-layer homology domain-containing protein [Oscillospiraceae bacterium]
MKKRLICLVLVLVFCLSLLPAGALAAETEPTELKLGILSDIHYFDYEALGPRAGDNTDRFVYAGEMELRLMAETEGILNAALSGLEEYGPDVVLVCGDLTSNGESSNAQSLADKLTAAEDSLGADIYVVNGNHDINNSYAVDFSSGGLAENADRMLPEGESGNFREMFKDLGYDSDDTQTVFYTPPEGENSGCLSYCTQIAEGVTLIVLDDNIYSTDTTARFDAAQQTPGAVSEDLLDWTIEQAKAAAEKGDLVLTMSHHGVVPHYDQMDEGGNTVTDAYSGETTTVMNYFDAHRTVADWREVATALADAGVSACFTGHSHCSDIARFTTEEGNTLYDIQTASLAAYPCAYREVTLTRTDGGWSFDIETEFVKSAAIRTTDKNDDGTTSVSDAVTRDDVQDYTYLITGPTEDKLGAVASYFIRSYMYEMKNYEGEYGTGLEGWIQETADLDKETPWSDAIIELLPDIDEGGISGEAEYSGIKLSYRLNLDKQAGQVPIHLDVDLGLMREQGVLTVDLQAFGRAIDMNLSDLNTELTEESDGWDTNYGSPALYKDVLYLADSFLKDSLTAELDENKTTALAILIEAYQAAAYGDTADIQESMAEKHTVWSGLLTGDEFAEGAVSAVKNAVSALIDSDKAPVFNSVLSKPYSEGINVFSFDYDEGTTGYLLMALCDSIKSTKDILVVLNLLTDSVLDAETLEPLSGLLAEFAVGMTTDNNIQEDLAYNFRAVRLDPQGGVVPTAYAVTLEDGSLASLPTPARDGCSFDGWFTQADGGEQVTADSDYSDVCAVYARWTREQSSGGGGGNENTLPVTVAPTENGTVTVSPQKATAGVDITVTPTAKDGYETDTVTVTDKNGNEVPVTQNDDGTYTFVMPEGGATVTATFKEKPDQPTPPDPSHNDNCPSKPFKDVDTTQWYHESIDYAIEHGLMNGVASDRFDPQGTTTRAMIVTILYRLEGEPQVDGENAFDDVEDGQWYTEPVIWANMNEIVNGYGNGKFGPTDNITREQFATILYRYAQFKGYDVSVGEDANVLSYDDASDISDWAMEAVQWAVGVGLINGRTESTIVPAGTATRAEAATLFMRFAENVAG